MPFSLLIGLSHMVTDAKGSTLRRNGTSRIDYFLKGVVDKGNFLWIVFKVKDLYFFLFCNIQVQSTDYRFHGHPVTLTATVLILKIKLHWGLFVYLFDFFFFTNPIC